MGEKLWTRNFVALTIANGLMFSSFYFLMPTLPIYAESLGANGTEIGIIGGIFGYSAIIIRLFTNNVARTFGKKNCLYIGLAISILVTISLMIFTAVDKVIIARFVHGFGFGLGTTFAAAIVLEVIPASRRGEGLGYFGLGATVGMAIAPALGLEIYDLLGANALFIISTACTILAAATVYFGDKIAEKKVTDSAHYRNFFERIVAQGTGQAAALAMLFSVAYGSVNTFIAMAAQEAGIAHASLFFVICTAFIFLVRPIGGRLFDTKGVFATLLPGAISMIIGLVLIFSAATTKTLLIAAVFHGIGAGFLMPSLMAWIVNSARPEQRNSAGATYYNMLDIGVGTGVLVFGTLAGLVGFVDVFKILTGVMILFVAILFRIKIKAV